MEEVDDQVGQQLRQDDDDDGDDHYQHGGGSPHRHQPKEEEVERMLSERLVEGFVLLEKACPACATPLIKRSNSAFHRKQLDPIPAGEELEEGEGVGGGCGGGDGVSSCGSSSGLPFVDSQSFMAPIRPIEGVPFCVWCRAHVVTDADEVMQLEGADHLKVRGSIMVAMSKEELEDDTLATVMESLGEDKEESFDNNNSKRVPSDVHEEKKKEEEEEDRHSRRSGGNGTATAGSGSIAGGDPPSNDGYGRLADNPTPLDQQQRQQQQQQKPVASLDGAGDDDDDLSCEESIEEIEVVHVDEASECSEVERRVISQNSTTGTTTAERLVLTVSEDAVAAVTSAAMTSPASSNDGGSHTSHPARASSPRSSGNEGASHRSHSTGANSHRSNSNDVASHTSHSARFKSNDEASHKSHSTGANSHRSNNNDGASHKSHSTEASSKVGSRKSGHRSSSLASINEDVSSKDPPPVENVASKDPPAGADSEASSKAPTAASSVAASGRSHHSNRILSAFEDDDKADAVEQEGMVAGGGSSKAASSRKSNNESKKSLADSSDDSSCASDVSSPPAPDAAAALPSKRNDDPSEDVVSMLPYEERRMLATRILGRKMVQGYKLTEQQCSICQMPLMEKKNKFFCVVCPVLRNPAVKEALSSAGDDTTTGVTTRSIDITQSRHTITTAGSKAAASRRSHATTGSSPEEQNDAPSTTLREKNTHSSNSAGPSASNQSDAPSKKTQVDEKAAHSHRSTRASSKKPRTTEVAGQVVSNQGKTPSKKPQVEEMTAHSHHSTKKPLNTEVHVPNSSQSSGQHDMDISSRMSSISESYVTTLSVASSINRDAIAGYKAGAVSNKPTLTNFIDSKKIEKAGESSKGSARGSSGGKSSKHSKAPSVAKVSVQDSVQGSMKYTSKSIRSGKSGAGSHQNRPPINPFSSSVDAEIASLTPPTPANRKKIEEEAAVLLAEAEKAEQAVHDVHSAGSIDDHESILNKSIRREQSVARSKAKRLEELQELLTVEKEKTSEIGSLADMSSRSQRQILDKESKLLKEIEKTKKARDAAELEARRLADEKRAYREAQLLSELEKEAEKRQKDAEEAMEKAKKAIDQVSEARQKILAETIAEGEASAIAEAESIVRSLAEDYQECSLMPTASDLHHERWDTLRAEGRSVMTRRVMAGWTVLPELCRGKECDGQPLLLDGSVKQCVVCGGTGTGTDGVYGLPVEEEGEDENEEVEEEQEEDGEEEHGRGHVAERPPATSMPPKEISTPRLNIQPPEPAVRSADHKHVSSPKTKSKSKSKRSTRVNTRTKDDDNHSRVSKTSKTSQSVRAGIRHVANLQQNFESKRGMVTKEIGKRMMKGWNLLDASCPYCVMPLMTDLDQKNEICVLCGVVGEVSNKKATKSVQTWTKGESRKTPQGERQKGGKQGGEDKRKKDDDDQKRLKKELLRELVIEETKKATARLEQAFKEKMGKTEQATPRSAEKKRKQKTKEVSSPKGKGKSKSLIDKVGNLFSKGKSGKKEKRDATSPKYESSRRDASPKKRESPKRKSTRPDASPKNHESPKRQSPRHDASPKNDVSPLHLLLSRAHGRDDQSRGDPPAKQAGIERRAKAIDAEGSTVCLKDSFPDEPPKDSSDKETTANEEESRDPGTVEKKKDSDQEEDDDTTFKSAATSASVFTIRIPRNFDVNDESSLRKLIKEAQMKKEAKEAAKKAPPRPMGVDTRFDPRRKHPMVLPSPGMTEASFPKIEQSPACNNERKSNAQNSKKNESKDDNVSKEEPFSKSATSTINRAPSPGLSTIGKIDRQEDDGVTETGSLEGESVNDHDISMPVRIPKSGGIKSTRPRETSLCCRLDPSPSHHSHGMSKPSPESRLDTPSLKSRDAAGDGSRKDPFNVDTHNLDSPQPSWVSNGSRPRITPESVPRRPGRTASSPSTEWKDLPDSRDRTLWLPPATPNESEEINLCNLQQLVCQQPGTMQLGCPGDVQQRTREELVEMPSLISGNTSVDDQSSPRPRGPPPGYEGRQDQQESSFPEDERQSGKQDKPDPILAGRKEDKRDTPDTGNDSNDKFGRSRSAERRRQAVDPTEERMGVDERSYRTTLEKYQEDRSVNFKEERSVRTLPGRARDIEMMRAAAQRKFDHPLLVQGIPHETSDRHGNSRGKMIVVPGLEADPSLEGSLRSSSTRGREAADAPAQQQSQAPQLPPQPLEKQQATHSISSKRVAGKDVIVVEGGPLDYDDDPSNINTFRPQDLESLRSRLTGLKSVGTETLDDVLARIEETKKQLERAPIGGAPHSAGADGNNGNAKPEKLRQLIDNLAAAAAEIEKQDRIEMDMNMNMCFSLE